MFLETKKILKEIEQHADITKEEAILRYGKCVINDAISLYETGIEKIFFKEDANEHTTEICANKFDYIYQARLSGTVFTPLKGKDK